MSIDRYVIGVAVGIGKSIAEAEYSLFEAKKIKKADKKRLKDRDNPPYFVKLYEGDKKPDRKTKIDPRVVDYLKLSKFLEEKGSEYIPYLEKIVKIDPGTSALTILGYRLEQDKRENELNEKRKPRKGERYFVLFDLNDVHDWNEKGASYASVTRHINVIGRALVENCRTKKNGYSDFVAQIKDPLVTRKHGDAGDEFMVDLYCPKKYVKGVVERLINTIYKAQKDQFYSNKNP